MANYGKYYMTACLPLRRGVPKAPLVRGVV